MSLLLCQIQPFGHARNQCHSTEKAKANSSVEESQSQKQRVSNCSKREGNARLTVVALRIGIAPHINRFTRLTHAHTHTRTHAHTHTHTHAHLESEVVKDEVENCDGVREAEDTEAVVYKQRLDIVQILSSQQSH